MSRAMKDSGIDWIGEIPMDWEILRGKTVFSQRNSKGNHELRLLSATQKQGMLPQDLLEGVVLTSENTDLSTFKTVHKNDFVISLRSFQGGFEKSNYEGVCSPAYQVFYNRVPIHHNFFWLLFKSLGFIDKINSLTVGIREGKNILYKDFSNMLLAVPSVAEQEAIAEFLDRKCGEVDEMVSLQEQVIEELKAYKQSVITEAVTKGLNPSAPMKPSNIDWIGQIPTHWEIPKLGTLFMIKAGGDAKPALYSDTLDELHKYPVYTNAKYSDQIYAYSSIALFPGNSITVTGRGDIGHAIYRDSPFDAIIRLLVLQPKNSSLVDSRYYTYFIDNVIHFFSDSAAVGQLSAIQISPYKVAYPPLSEQREIADFLDRKCADIDALIALKQQKIEELKQYKKSLIYEYVTGKKAVPCGANANFTNL